MQHLCYIWIADCKFEYDQAEKKEQWTYQRSKQLALAVPTPVRVRRSLATPTFKRLLQDVAVQNFSTLYEPTDVSEAEFTPWKINVIKMIFSKDFKMSKP